MPAPIPLSNDEAVEAARTFAQMLPLRARHIANELRNALQPLVGVVDDLKETGEVMGQSPMVEASKDGMAGVERILMVCVALEGGLK